MGLLRFFSPRSFEIFEEKGDRLVGTNDLGLAKLQYEKGMSRLEDSHLPDVSRHRDRLKMKIQAAGESLAQQHRASAEELLEASCFEEAEELLNLARELTCDPKTCRDIDSLAADVASGHNAAIDAAADEKTMDPEAFDPDDEDAHFLILCSTLPDDVQADYLAFGKNFQSGYIALNQGMFELAAELLNEAMTDQGERVTYVHLELATAYLNLGDTDAAQSLLEMFIQIFPDSLRAYEMLCEIYWESGEYDCADKLLQACPDTLKTSVPLLLLMGETLFRSGKEEASVSFYLKSIEYLGWNEPIAVALARTYETVGREKEALAAYQEVMTSCKSCHRQVNPFVRRRYAELSYGAGDISGGLLETYFSLCREDPQNQRRYFRRVSDIYRRQGHHEEARRYLEIARRTQRGRG